MLAALALASLCAALGLRLLPRYRGPFGSATLALLSSTVLGGAVLAVATLTIGSLAGVTPMMLGVILALAAVAGAWRRLGAAVRDCTRELGRTLTPLSAVLIAVTTAATLAGAARVPVDFDALMYHLQGPATYLAEGHLGTVAGNAHVAYLGVVHHLYLPLLAFGGAEAPALFEALCLLGLLLTLASAADAWGRPRSGAAAAVLLLASPMFVLTAVTAKVDIAVVLTLTLGFVTLIAAARGRRGAPAQCLVAGALFGTAIGIKAIAVPFVAASLLSTAPLAWAARHRANVRRLAAVGALALLGTAAPWLLRTAVLYGNPLYPTVGAEQAPTWLPGEARALGPIAVEPMHTVRQTFTPMRWLLAPATLTPEGDGATYGLPIVFLLAALAPVLARTRAERVPAATAAVFVLGVWLYQPYLNLRYLMPALPLLAMATAGALTAVFARAARWRPHARAAVSLLAAVAVARPVQHALTRALDSHPPVGPAELALLKDFAATRIRPDARMLFLWEARGFGFGQEVLQDNVMKNWLYVQRADSLAGCLPASGIDYVVVSRSTMQYLAARGLDTLQLGWDRFPAFQRRCLLPVVRFPTHDLYAMRRPGAMPAPGASPSKLP